MAATAEHVVKTLLVAPDCKSDSDAETELTDVADDVADAWSLDADSVTSRASVQLVQTPECWSTWFSEQNATLPSAVTAFPEDPSNASQPFCAAALDEEDAPSPLELLRTVTYDAFESPRQLAPPIVAPVAPVWQAVPYVFAPVPMFAFPIDMPTQQTTSINFVDWLAAPAPVCRPKRTVMQRWRQVESRYAEEADPFCMQQRRKAGSA